MISEFLKLGHSVVWAVALCAIAWIVAPAFKPVAQPLQQGSAIATSQVQAIAQRAAASEAAQIVKRALPGLHISAGELATAFSALHPPTKTVVYAATKVIAPSPVPQPTAAPGMSKGLSQFYFDTAYSADVAALHNTKIDNTLHIEQQPAALSRWSTAISSAGAAGFGYDIARRGPMNITISALQERSIMPALGMNYCPKALGSLCAGVMVDGKGKVSAALQAHF